MRVAVYMCTGKAGVGVHLNSNAAVSVSVTCLPSVPATGVDRELQRLLGNEKANFRVLAEKVGNGENTYTCTVSKLVVVLLHFGGRNSPTSRNPAHYIMA